MSAPTEPRNHPEFWRWFEAKVREIETRYGPTPRRAVRPDTEEHHHA